MHEVAIAEALIEQVTGAASRHGLTAVRQVGICVGARSGVVADALSFAFHILRTGPVLGGAVLEVRTTEGDDLSLEWIEGE